MKANMSRGKKEKKNLFNYMKKKQIIHPCDPLVYESGHDHEIAINKPVYNDPTLSYAIPEYDMSAQIYIYVDRD